MKRLDDDPFAEAPDDTEALSELGEEDRDFLRCLEKMMEEVEPEPKKSK
jgi:hypothetical protein